MRGVYRMKILCIYGCGGVGREISDLSYNIGKWQKIVFVDDNITNRIVYNIEVYSLEEILKEFDKDSVEFIIATGEPVARKSIYNKLKDFSLNCISIIDQNFKLSSSSSIEEGTIVHTGAVITCNVHVGKGCFINKGVVIGHDVTLGDFCVISPNATISGDVEIGENCYIGSGAVIRNGVTIGRDSIIGMGAVVLEDVKPESVMVGNPAKLLRKNESKKVF